MDFLAVAMGGGGENNETHVLLKVGVPVSLSLPVSIGGKGCMPSNQYNKDIGT